jgi:glycosyltransferase involved in cell wall biosynthesis
MHVRYFGTYDRDYCRNQILQRGLALAGAHVSQCHAQVWNTLDKSQVKSLAGKLGTDLRFLASRISLRRQYAAMAPCDVLLVGYLGHLDVGLARRIAHGKPVVLDAFLSLWETVVEDRKLLRPQGLAAQFLRSLERRAYLAADLILLDTQAHIEWVAQEFHVPVERFARVFVGADDRVFHPPGPDEAPPPADGPREVLFYGKFIPLHGVEIILRAAHLLAGESDIRFTLVGTGQTYAAARELAASLRLPRVTWVDWLDYEALPRAIWRAHVCLGVFGPEGKALRVIPNKVFQALACGAPVITADSPAMRELPPMGPALTLIPPGDPEALAAAIRTACAAPRPLHPPENLRAILPQAIGGELLAELQRRFGAVPSTAS